MQLRVFCFRGLGCIRVYGKNLCRVYFKCNIRYIVVTHTSYIHILIHVHMHVHMFYSGLSAVPRYGPLWFLGLKLYAQARGIGEARRMVNRGTMKVRVKLVCRTKSLCLSLYVRPYVNIYLYQYVSMFTVFLSRHYTNAYTYVHGSCLLLLCVY